MTVPSLTIPWDVSRFLRWSADAELALLTLAIPEALTDALARALIAMSCKLDPDPLIDALHLTDFVVERNSEWNLAARARRPLLTRAEILPDHVRRVNGYLVELTQSSQRQAQFDELPNYLLEGPGAAYHQAAIDPATGLRTYSALALSPAPRVRWLSVTLAQEQVSRGLLDKHSLEIHFLKGMALYGEGRRSDAEPYLRNVAVSQEHRFEVGVASHLVGRYEGRRGRHNEAIPHLEKSLEILEVLDDPLGVALVQSSLGHALLAVRRNDEAREYLTKSIQGFDDLGAQEYMPAALQVLARDAMRTGQPKDALPLIRRALDIGASSNYRARYLVTLGEVLQAVPDADPGEAEAALTEAIDVASTTGDWSGAAGAFHALARVRERSGANWEEVEHLLRASLDLGRRSADLGHLAQVTMSLGRHVFEQDRDEGARLLMESWDINNQLGNLRGRRIAELELKRHGLPLPSSPGLSRGAKPARKPARGKPRVVNPADSSEVTDRRLT